LGGAEYALFYVKDSIRMITIKEIAAQLNLSFSTVSKALNNATDISKETKKRVLDYAKKAGYRPKAQKKSQRISVLYEQNESNGQFNVLHTVINAFADIAFASGFEVITESVNAKPQDFNLEKHLIGGNFCAAFLVGLNFDSMLFKQLKSTVHPLVLLDNHIPDTPLIASVSSDNMSAIEQAVKYLNSRGHTKIGFLSGEKQSMVCAERFAGYILGSARLGINFNNDYVYYGDFTKKSGEDAAQYFKGTDVTAVVCCSDIMAIGLIDGLRQNGINVPSDISVVGFDDLEVLSLTNYNLTTLKQDFKALGENAFAQIRDMLDGRTPQKFVQPCKLVERKTVISIN